MKKLDDELQERLEKSRLRLLNFLLRETITPDSVLCAELRIYVTLRYGTIRFAWEVLWETLKQELKTRWLLWRYRDVETWSAEKTQVEIAKLDREIERCSGLKFNQN